MEIIFIRHVFPTYNRLVVRGGANYDIGHQIATPPYNFQNHFRNYVGADLVVIMFM